MERRNTVVATMSVLLVVITACLASAVFAAGKVTVDPNRPGASAQATSSPDEDVLLSQKVTYEARHTAVEKILEDLAAMTGVKLVAGLNTDDWQVRDRRMNIFAKNIPLASLMNSIADTMKFKWRKSDGKPPSTYCLYMPRATVLGAEAEEYRMESALDEKATSNRTRFLDAIMSATSQEPADLEQMRQDNPYLYLLHERGTCDYLRAMFKEAPGLQQKFLSSSSNAAYPVSSLSPDTQQLLLHAVQQAYKTVNPPYGGDGSPFPSDYAAKLVSKGVATFELTPRPYSWRMGQRDWHFGGMGVSIDGRFFSVGELRDPDDPQTKQCAKAEVDATEQGVPFDWMGSVNNAVTQHKAEARKGGDTSEPGEPRMEHADEPALHVKVKLDKCPDKLVELQAALAKASGLAIVSDSFWLTKGSARISNTEDELANLLNSLADGYYYNWDKHGSVIEFRNRYWFKYRSSQVPEQWLDRWRDDTIKAGAIPLDDYAQIAWLSYDQIQENLLDNEDFPKTTMTVGGWGFIDNVALLRSYTTFSASQRQLLFSSAGLSIRSLRGEQLKLVNALAGGRGDGKLSASYLPDGNAPTGCEWNLRDADGKSLRKWSVQLPIYIRPPTGDRPKAQPNNADRGPSTATAK